MTGRKHFSLTKKGVGLFSNFEFYYGNPNTNGVMHGIYQHKKLSSYDTGRRLMIIK